MYTPTHIHRQISFDLGFLDPSFQCTDYLEIPHVELVYCDEDQCQLLGFFTLGGKFCLLR